MAKIAYVDHSYHSKTRSTDFLAEALMRAGHIVERIWDDSWKGGQAVAWESVQSHDVVIMFQAYTPIDEGYFRARHPNVIYVPMLDQFGLWHGPQANQAAFWEPFQGSKILSFSTALHAMASSMGIASHRTRYYQPPRDRQASFTDGLRGFFWLRRELDIPWSVIRALIAKGKFESFHVHLAPDPGSPVPTPPSAEDVGRFNITTSSWFEDKTDLDSIIDRANVYFAPRLGEGIGQSFLEALARGQCVVAPDHGTMNEYIVSGLNGLLYDERTPLALDFSRAEILGGAASQASQFGFLAWKGAEGKLVDFILTPSESLYEGKYRHPLADAPQTTSDVPGETAASHLADMSAKVLQLPRLPSLRKRAREISAQFWIFRATRWMWHPIVVLSRTLRNGR